MGVQTSDRDQKKDERGDIMMYKFRTGLIFNMVKYVVKDIATRSGWEIEYDYEDMFEVSFYHYAKMCLKCLPNDAIEGVDIQLSVCNFEQLQGMDKNMSCYNFFYTVREPNEAEHLEIVINTWLTFGANYMETMRNLQL